MPKYNFKCDACGKDVERSISFSMYDEEVKKQLCNCGADTPLRRVFEPSRFAYVKGSWMSSITHATAEEYKIREREATTEKKSSW